MWAIFYSISLTRSSRNDKKKRFQSSLAYAAYLTSNIKIAAVKQSTGVAES